MVRPTSGGSPSFANPYNDITGDPTLSLPNKFPFTVPGVGATIDWADLYSLLELSTFDPQYTVPYVQNFNLNIQRALPSNMVLQIGYVGSLGHRLASWYEGDPITPAGHAACLADPVCTANISSIHLLYPQYTAAPGAIAPTGQPWYLSVARQNTENSSNYNALQISVIKARTHGLYATFAYTYSHSLDNGSGYESTTGAATNNSGHAQIYTPGFTYLNYGDSDFDARHRFVTSYIYEVPIPGSLRDNRLLRSALGGWQIAGVTALQTGFPIGIQEGKDISGWCDGFSYFGCGDVPVTSSFKIQKFNPRNGNNTYFSPATFSDEPIGTFGNVKRGLVHGPGYNYTNLSLAKNLHLFSNEQRYIQLRVEAANAFNHANFAPPGGDFANPSTFGVVTSVLSSADPNQDPEPARVFQLVGKFFF